MAVTIPFEMINIFNIWVHNAYGNYGSLNGGFIVFERAWLQSQSFSKIKGGGLCNQKLSNLGLVFSVFLSCTPPPIKTAFCYVCFTRNTFRQRRVRLDKLVNLCQKLNLPCPNLVAETALLMLDRDLADSRKNITLKLMGAAIYTSCKFHSIQITSKVNVLFFCLLILNLH